MMSFYLFKRYFLSSRSGSLIKFISKLCLAGITVSIAALILIISVMGGFGEAIQSRLLSQQAHLIIEFDTNPFTQKKYSSNKNQQEKNLFLDQKNKDTFFLNAEQKKGLKHSEVFENQELILKNKDSFKGVSARGYSKKIWDQKQQKALTEIDISIINTTPKLDATNTSNLSHQTNDKALNYFSQQAKQKSLVLKPNFQKKILISYDLSRQLDISIGDTLTFIPLGGLLLPPNLPPPVKLFQVSGILHSKISSLHSSYYQQGAMDFGSFSNISYKAELQIKDPKNILEYQKLFKSYNIKNWMQQNSNLFFALKLEKFIMTLFFIIALLISCLGVSSALLLLMTQKAEDIAILQTMGLTQTEIVKTFTYIGVYLSSLGMLLGTAIGLSLTLFLKYNRWNILPEMYQDRTLPTAFMSQSYLVILIGTFLLAWMFSYLPSFYFSRSNLLGLLKSNHH